MAFSLYGQLWAVNSLVTNNLEIRCFSQIYVVHLSPPLHILSIENGSDDHSPKINILAKSEFTGCTDISSKRYFFTMFSAKYQITCIICVTNYN